MKTRGFLTASLYAVLLLLMPSVAWAVPSLDMDSHIVDKSGLLSADDKAEITKQIKRASSENIPYYLVLVDDWEGKTDNEWCAAIGKASQIESSAIIWGIAKDLSEYNVCLSDNGAVSVSDANDAARNGAGSLSSNLSGEQIRQGVQTMVDELIAATQHGGNSGEAPGNGSDLDFSDGTSPLMSFVFFLIIVGFPIFLVLIAWNARKNKRTTRQVGSGLRADPAKRFSEANALLMKTDDAVRSAVDDLAYARAQFGELETERFNQAVSRAEENMTRAFQLQTQYEEAPHDGARLEIVDQIEKLCNKSLVMLDEHVKQFAKLRNVEANVEQNIATARTRVREARERVHRAEREIESLKIMRSEQILNSILGNPATAARLLDAAEQALDEAESVKDNNRQDAVFNINLAQRATNQALGQIDQVLTASHDLDNAKTRLNTAIASISSDLDDVKKLAADSANFDVLVKDAHEAIALGDAARKGQGDPLAALSRLREAEDALDAALAPLRNQAAQTERLQRRLSERFQEVDRAIARANSHISAHLHAADRQARALVAEARNKRSQAQRIYQQDPEQALDLLSQALLATQQAIDAVSQYSDPYSGPFSGPSSGGSRDGIDLSSLILGGLLFGNRGGGRSSNWGSSSSWGGFSSGGFGGFGSGFSSGGSGSFGGGSFGGGFSSGGSGKF